jgi:hypothetical protein
MHPDRVLLALGFFLGFAAAARGASGQCVLANPSFEISGASGLVFAGWNQVGAVGAAAIATHGARSARVSGPNTGDWDVSAFWQRLDTSPGERWTASVQVWHASAHPLTGQARAIVNIEWRDAAGNLIGYESHTAADASTPVDHASIFATTSQPAPEGTASTRLFLGVLQGPTDPVPEVYFDQATFEGSGPPTFPDLQWTDFPGGRTITWGGRIWRVKGPGFDEPGPNFYSDSATSSWIDVQNRLHLTIQDFGGWTSSEVALEDPLGYGDYVFTTVGRLDAWDPNVVLGLFLWQYARCYDPANGWWNPYDEIDVEYGRWDNPARAVGQFVVQPFDLPGNIHRFDAVFAPEERTSHAFRWLPGRVEFRSWRGGPDDETPANSIATWTYSGPQLPRPEQPRVHVNLWYLGAPPSTSQEVILDSFRFVPADALPTDAGNPRIAARTRTSGHLEVVGPNPFGPTTMLEFSVERPGFTQLVVYDASGRQIRTLVRGTVTSGRHQVHWDGRDDAGLRVASGVYLCQLRSGRQTWSRRVVLLR